MAAKDISKTLVLKDGVTGTLKKAIGGTVEYKRHLRDLQQVGAKAWDRIKTGAMATATAMGAAATAMTGIGIRVNASLETAEQSFSILLNSAEAAKQMVSDLQRQAERSPFEFAGLQKSAKTLLGMGFAGQQVIPIMQILGDAVAATGGNTEQLEGIALALGQIQAKGKLSAEEVNQLAERGIPVWQMLSQEMGKTPAELMKLAEQGKLLSGQVLPLLFTGLEKRFGGSMQKMSDTFEYTVANIKESGARQLANITSPLFEAIKEDLRGIQSFLDSDRAAEWGARFSQGIMAVYTGAKATAETIWSISSFISENWSVIGPIVYGVAGAFVAHKIAVYGSTIAIKLFGKESTFAAVKTQIMGTAALVASGQVGILRGSVLLLNAAFRANPIGFVITLLGMLVTAGIYVVQNWETVKQKGKELWNVTVDAAEWGVNKYIDYANFMIRGYKYAWDVIKFGAVSMWNGIVTAAEWGARNMLEPLNAALEAVGGKRIDVDFGAAKFSEAAAPTWDNSYNPIPQVSLRSWKASTSVNEIEQARKEQQEARKAQVERDKRLADALDANTAALTFNTDATAGNTAATDKNTKARLRDDLSPMDLADSLLGRIERHIWAT
ncbi:tape measure protein [Brevibacillus borstelensis]|uniref:tape measure protein n=1 Tax=Brevibacillus borstelensis TaxID=45462 RepID=UPI002E2352CB|nr:tape measure protein [Brevibacillus borstelensis]